MATSFFGTMRVRGLPGKDSKGCIADGKTVASAKSASGRRLERTTGSAALASIRFCCNGLGLSRIQRIPSEEGKNYALHFLKLHFFTRKKSEVLGNRRNTKQGKAKVTVEKTSNRAGATPLFRLSAAQKVRGVAPALRHGKSCRPFFPR